MPKQQITGASTPIRVACGVCAVMLLWTLGACGRPIPRGDVDSAGSPTADRYDRAGAFNHLADSLRHLHRDECHGIAGRYRIGQRRRRQRDLEQPRNGTSGSASGTGNWSIASITLAQGANQVTVTAHDTAAIPRAPP